MHGKSAECHIKEEDEEEERQRRRSRSALQTTWRRPLRTDPSLAPPPTAAAATTSPPRPCPSSALFLMLSFCLPLTDLLRGADQKRVPSSHLIPRFFSSSSSTDSLPSLPLSPSFPPSRPGAREYVLELWKGKKRGREG